MALLSCPTAIGPVSEVLAILLLFDGPLVLRHFLFTRFAPKRHNPSSVPCATVPVTTPGL